MGSDDIFCDSLNEAVRFGDLELVLELLNKGHNPNAIGLYKWTSVHEAAHNGENDILRVLLNNGGNANQPDDLKHNTPLHYAANEGYCDCVQLLLAAGSKVMASNVDRQTPSDIALDGCKDILLLALKQEQIKADLEDYNKNNSTSGETDPQELDVLSDLASDWSVSNSLNESYESSFSATSTERKDEKNLGFLELSFEYNSRRSLLKVRVWQLGDIVLPPPHTSTISGVYVKTLLLPDQNQSSKQRTEIVKFHQSASHELPTNQTGYRHIYSATAVTFAKPLVYSCVNDDIVGENRRLRFEVCLTQRYTRKSFFVATTSVDVKDAIKNLVRKRYPLTPCTNHAIPMSMTIHRADRSNVLSLQSHPYRSNPELSDLSLTSLRSHRASSDLDLHTVIGSTPPSPVPMVVIAMPDDDDDESVELSNILVNRNNHEELSETKLNIDSADCDHTHSSCREFNIDLYQT